MRLRVVFNGSWTVSGHFTESAFPCQTESIASLTILLRWHWHRYVIAADVEKMYRS